MSIFKKIEPIQTSYMQGITYAESLVQEWQATEPGIDPRYLYERLVRSVLSAWPEDFKAGYKGFASHVMKTMVRKCQS